MEESGGPDVARGEVGKVFIMQVLCLITDRQTDRQADRRTGYEPISL